jgi:hypothetical protein
MNFLDNIPLEIILAAFAGIFILADYFSWRHR